MSMRLAGADDAHGKIIAAIAAHHESRAAVGDGTAIEQLQRSGDRLGVQCRLDSDRLAELRARMQAGVPAHQHGKLRQVGLAVAVFMHVARCHQAVVRGNGCAERHFVRRVADLHQCLDCRVAALAG